MSASVRSAGCEAADVRVHRISAALLGVVLALLIILMGSACASETDLLTTLKSTQDPVEREEAAHDLALLHSVAATKSLAAAAQSDETARAGLDSLTDAYVLLIDSTIQRAEAQREEFSDKSRLALLDAVQCLKVIGDTAAIQALGALATDTQRERIEAAAPDFSVPDLAELQLQSIAALSELADDPAALTALVEVASLPGDAESTGTLREAAAAAIRTRPEAVESLFRARVEAGDDQKLCASLDATLAAMGEAAVETLTSALADQTWTDEILAEIGTPAVVPVSKELGSDNAKVRWRALGVLLRLYAKGDAAASAVVTKPEMVPLLIEARRQATYGDDRDDAAVQALAAIGGPAVEPVKAFVGKDTWAADVLAQMGAPAVPALTALLGSDDRILRFAAADVLVRIENSAPESVSVLTADLDEEDLKPIAANYAYYIRLGRAGSEDVLARALNKYGDKEMAVDYLNCGNGTLEQAAHTWADKHGYEVYTTPGVATGPQWGEGE